MAAIVLYLSLAGPVRLAAQTGPVVARAASVTGTAMVFTGSAGSSFGLSAGFLLNPGDRVDTRSGGRVVIDISDGSMVVVEPQSVVVLKDYRQAESLRELFEILLGKVRVKINHFGGRPNPYRMNSPTASIAVRGTEFSIEVSPSGDTRVVVYEGAVEVTNLSDPGQTVLVEAGRGILVQAGLDFHMLGAAGNLLASGQSLDGRHTAPPIPGYRPPGLSPAASMHGDNDCGAPRATLSAYGSYVSGLSDMAQMPFLYRFNAFPEAHLDSLENPAYATQFHAAEARLVVLPTFGGGPATDQSPQTFVPAGGQSSNYSLSPQGSIFSPIGHSGWVVGGGVSATGAGNSASTSVLGEDCAAAPGSLSAFTGGTSSSTFYSGSLALARRFGSATSVGVEFDSLQGNGTLSGMATETDPQYSVEQVLSASRISQTRLTAGLSRDLGAKTKLGVFYRYGFISATDRDVSHTFNGSPLGLNSTDSAGHSSEIGIRLRGVITPRLFYGIAGSWSNVSLGDGLIRTNSVDARQRDRAQNGSAGFGLGYSVSRRVVATFDADAGTSRIAAQRVEDATGNTLQNGTANGQFFSAHAAIQGDLTRRLFASASFLNVWHSQLLHVDLFPDRTGAMDMLQNAFFPSTPSAYQLASHFSDFGLGWRFSRHLFVQYLFTTDYGVTVPSHALMFRYTFKFRNPVTGD